MTPEDSVTPGERLRPYQRRYPWWVAIIVLLLFVYGLTDAITRWGERVDFKITHSCGI